mmetsp:Transcript_29634/g.60846  ORF Transcript_29634/g.60846 Transcript_29634/m.60846 type:complete len:96 (-) Transcript_29634:1783-2070(-)
MKGARKYLKSKRMKEKQHRQAEEKKTTLERRRLHRAAMKQPQGFPVGHAHHCEIQPGSCVGGVPFLALGLDAVLPRLQLVALQRACTAVGIHVSI